MQSKHKTFVFHLEGWAYVQIWTIDFLQNEINLAV